MHQSLNTTNLVVQLDDAVQRWSINNTFHYAVVGENYSVTAISTFLDSEYEFIRHFIFVTPSLNDYAVQSHYCIESQILVKEGMRAAYYNRSLIPPHNSSLDYTLHHPKGIKMLITRHILELGYSLIYIDTDLYVYGDLDSELSSLPYMDAYFATDRRCCRKLCDGFMFLHPSQELIDIIWDSFKYYPMFQYHDQPALTKTLHERRFKYGLIPFSIVENGFDFFSDKSFGPISSSIF